MFCFNCNEKLVQEQRFCPKCGDFAVQEEVIDDSYIEALENAAESGDAASCLKLGQCYENGFGVEVSLEKAYEWYKEAKEIGHPKAAGLVKKCVKRIGYRLFDGGNLWNEAGDYEEAFELYKEAVEKWNCRWAKPALAKCYEEGRGVEEDIDKAIFLYTQAAEEGHAEAQLRLSMWYLKNDKPKEAFNWMLQAAQSPFSWTAISCGLYSIKPYSKPMDYMGHFYSAGIGVEKNDEEAIKWYLKAYPIDLDNYNKTNRINYMLERILKTAKELGINWNDEVAFPWYLKLAQSGDAGWQEEVASRYEQGIGVEKDESQAFYWKFQSAKNGNVELQYNIAYCYENGIGVEKNLTKAFYLYRKASENGIASAQSALGRFYEEGIAVQKDLEQALQWYKEASKQGDEFAKKRIKELRFL